LNKPVAAYNGNESYVFVCYSHVDSDSVYSDLIALDQRGIKFWYDEGISAGSSWRAKIADAIKGAKQFIFFISEASLKSSHCLREVDYAINNDIEIIPVYLESCELPAELDLVLNRVHALFKSNDSLYIEHLLEALRVSKGPTAFSPPSKNRKFRFGLAVLLTVMAIGVLVVWQQWDKLPVGESAGPDVAMAPSAFDRYLEGLDLLERWDKGDNLESAIGLFREATELDPGFALAYARLAGALRMRYALTREDIWLEEAIENSNEALRLNPGLAPVQVALGRIQATQGNYDLAFAALEKALAIDPNDPEANHAMAKMYEGGGRLEDAEASLQKALALDPESLLIRDSYANFLSGQGRFEEAIEQWKTVIRAAPDHYAVLVNLGATLTDIGRIPEAINMYEASIEIHPTYMAYSNLGTAYSRVERYPDAVEAFQQALKIDDSDWLAWGNLAYVYSWANGMTTQTTETFEHAIELAEAARQRNPRDAWVHSDLSLYYAKTGQIKLAMQRLETAVTLSPDSGEILAAVVEAYEQTGQRDKAVEFAQKAFELGYPREQFQRNPEVANLLKDPRMQNSP